MKTKRIYFTILIWVNFLSISRHIEDYERMPNSVDMCSFECDREMNTLCKYCPPGPRPNCGEDIKVFNITEAEQIRIVDLHNNLRKEASSGIGRFQKKSAYLMYRIEWHDDLAKQAQRWANQCQEGHDECRRTCQFYFSAQNLARVDEKTIPTIEELFAKWVDEGKYVGYDNIRNNRIKGVAENYYDLIYEKTTKIGCGMIASVRDSSKPDIITTSFVCNYAPAGSPIISLDHQLYRESNRSCEGCIGNFQECVNHLCECRYGADCYFPNENIADPSCPHLMPRNGSASYCSTHSCARHRVGFLIGLFVCGVLAMIVISVYVFVQLMNTTAIPVKMCVPDEPRICDQY